jgi:hypothetical protein
LRTSLRRDNPGDCSRFRRFASRRRIRVRRILAAHPRVAHLEQHRLQIQAIGQSIREPAWCSKSRRLDSQPRLKRLLRQSNIVGNDFIRRFALD